MRVPADDDERQPDQHRHAQRDPGNRDGQLRRLPQHAPDAAEIGPGEGQRDEQEDRRPAGTAASVEASRAAASPTKIETAKPGGAALPSKASMRGTKERGRGHERGKFQA